MEIVEAEVVKLKKDREFLLRSCKLALRMLGNDLFYASATDVLKAAVASIEEGKEVPSGNHETLPA